MISEELKTRFRGDYGLTVVEIGLLERADSRNEYMAAFLKSNADLKWFYALRDLGYFLPNEDVQPLEGERKGYFRIPSWLVLPYLEGVASSLIEPDNEHYAEEILQIIRDVTKQARDSKGKLDNYRIWSSFAQIIGEVPAGILALSDMDLIPIWLDSRFDTSLPSVELFKLLGRLLREEHSHGIDLAERLFAHLTELRWQDDSDEPSFRVDEHWLEEALLKNKLAEQLGERCSPQIVHKMADRLKESLRKRKDAAWKDADGPELTYRLTIRHTSDHTFKCEVGTYPKASSDEGNRLLEAMQAEPEVLFTFVISECSSRQDFSQRATSGLDRHEAGELRHLSEEELEQLYGSIFSDYSYIWCQTIAEGSGLGKSAKELTILVLRDLLIGKSNTDVATCRQLLIQFLSEDYPYPIFSRMAIYVSGKKWEDYGDFFWNVIFDGEVSEDDLFESSDYESEFYELLETNAEYLGDEVQAKLKTIIQVRPSIYLPDENVGKYRSAWRQKWYSALRSISEFDRLYFEEHNVTQAKEHLNFREGTTVWVGPGDPPFSIKEMLTESNAGLVEKIAGFKDPDRWGGPTVEGLSQGLKDAVKSNPAKFTGDCSPLLSLSYLHFSDLLDGFRTAWVERKELDWLPVLQLIRDYVGQDGFWYDDINRRRANHTWVIRALAELLISGTQKDDNAFSEECISLARELICHVVDDWRVEGDVDTNDPLMRALNSAIGKTTEALIDLSLRISRLRKANDPSWEENPAKWDEELKTRFDSLLEKGVVEAYALLGSRIGNFYHLDKPWVDAKIVELANAEDENLWFAFMYSYLFSSRVFRDLYVKMRAHYERALDSDRRRQLPGNRIADHFCIAYLRRLEELEDQNGLLRRLLDEGDKDEILEIVNFLWHEGRHVREEKGDATNKQREVFRQRGIAFWRWLTSVKLRNPEQNDDLRMIASTSGKLAIYLNQLDDESFEWMKLSARCQEVNEFNYPFILENLNRLTGEGPDRTRSVICAGEILVEMMNRFLPDYDQANIIPIVESLYAVGDDEARLLARRICDKYALGGYEFLREIARKYRN